MFRLARARVFAGQCLLPDEAESAGAWLRSALDMDPRAPQRVCRVCLDGLWPLQVS